MIPVIILVFRILEIVRILGVVRIILFSNGNEGSGIFTVVFKEVDFFIFFESKLDTTELIIRRSLYGLPMKIILIATSAILIIYDNETAYEMDFS